MDPDFNESDEELDPESALGEEEEVAQEEGLLIVPIRERQSPADVDLPEDPFDEPDDADEHGGRRDRDLSKVYPPLDNFYRRPDDPA